DGISREHYVSRAVLGLIEENGVVAVSGAHWLQGKDRCIPINVLKSKILCERHNCALSPLDVAAVQLYEALHSARLMHALHGVHGTPGCLLLGNGHDIERWCVKLMAGLLFSRSARAPARPDGREPLRKTWVDFLFGNRARLP